MRGAGSVFFLWVLFSAGAPAAGRLQYFCGDYLKCRGAFRESVASATKAWPAAERGAVQTGAWRVPSAVDPDLTIDWVYFPPKQKRKSLVVLSSGVHGVEGFAGSAMQQLFLHELLPKLPHDDIGYLIVHTVNPYGFKYYRRVSEHNVDLNRNFDTDRQLFSIHNPGYAALNEILNPTKPAADGFLPRLKFYWSAARMAISGKLRVLRASILSGQYEFDKGLYFGGHDFEPQKELLEKGIGEKFAGYQNALLLDLHTGYGKPGALHLMPAVAPEPAVAQATKAVFAERPIEDPSGPDFYPNFGDFSTFLAKLATARKLRAIPMTLEFGTFDNTGYYGGAESLRRMIVENEAHFYGLADEQQAKALRHQFLELYYPGSRNWRKQVLDTAAGELPRYIRNFHSLGEPAAR